MDLSIVMPAYRQDRWKAFYESVEQSFHGTWELIIVGPKEPTFQKDNMRWIEDWGSPGRCCQIGLLAAQGDYVTFTWDDAIYVPNMLDATWNILREQDFDPKVAVASKFVEGETAFEWALVDSFSLVTTHNDARMPCIPPHFLVQNTGMTARSEILAIGGIDTRFDAMAYPVLDLGIRLQANGVKMILQQGVVLNCTWELGGEHKVIEDAWKEHDKPIYLEKYKNEIPIHVELDNWKNSPAKFERRYGK